MLCLKFIPLIFLSVLLIFPTSAIRSLPSKYKIDSNLDYIEAPAYQNGQQCPVILTKSLCVSTCDPSLIHVAMTLDTHYLRGSIAAIHSILKHTCCPENVFFHFISLTSTSHLTRTVKSTFPSLHFKVYEFDEDHVKGLISSSIREALDQPLNYARIYLAEMLDLCIGRVIYLDSDVIVIDDVQKLWSISLPGSRVIGAPEYCHANFKSYFTDEFWNVPEFSRVFKGKKACYFNTGVMVMDLDKWRRGDYSKRIEKWMEIQKETRIYNLGSLPPFLLVFGGDVQGIDHRWNQHGLGGNNVVNSCRSLHPGKVSLMHWSGKGKPWDRLDAGMACPVDHLWAPYDLFQHKPRTSSHDSL